MAGGKKRKIDWSEIISDVTLLSTLIITILTFIDNHYSQKE